MTALLLVLAVLVFGVLSYAIFASNRERSRLPWWLHPALLGGMVGAVPLFLAEVTPAQTFRTLWRTPKFFTTTHLAIGLALLGFFVVGSILGSHRRRMPPARAFWNPRTRTVWRASQVLFYLTVLGYMLIFVVALGRGISLAQASAALGDQGAQLTAVKHTYLAPIAGVTTLTQFGPVAIVLLLWASATTRRRLPKVQLAVVLLLTLLRALVRAERLALLEVVLPGFIAWLAIRRYYGRSSRIAHRTIVALFPVWAPILLLMVFGVFEFGRSWSTYYQRDLPAGTQYLNFAAQRLHGYYATASNNGALLYDDFRGRVQVPFYTLAGVWQFPVVEALADHASINRGVDVTEAWREELRLKANPEFNSESGLFPVTADWGPAGAAAWWLIAGLIAGRLYWNFRAGTSIGMILFPFAVTGLFEMGRLVYWTQGRAVPTILGGLLVVRILSKRNGVEASAATVEARQHALVG